MLLSHDLAPWASPKAYYNPINNPHRISSKNIRLGVAYCSKSDVSFVSFLLCQSLSIHRCVVHKQCSTIARSKDSIYNGGDHKRNSKKCHATFLHSCGNFVTSGSQSDMWGTGTKHQLGRLEQRQATMQNQDQIVQAQPKLRMNGMN